MSDVVRRVLVLNGATLNMLGVREPATYGSESLDQIMNRLEAKGLDQGFEVECFQSNSEETLINKIQGCMDNRTSFIVFNPAAFTHTSVAIRDALLGVSIPFIEVHLSNIHAREEFRRKSYFSDIAVAVICGLGGVGYEFAVDYAIGYLAREET